MTSKTSSAHGLDGKVVLVTGAGSGIGRATALAFARAGAAVVLAGRRRVELEKVAREMEAIGARALVVPTDLAQPEQIERLFSSIKDRFQRLDVAFNNAGVVAFKPIEQLTLEDFDRTFAVNVRAAWLSMKYEMELIGRVGGSGSIINNSSWLSQGAVPGASIYSASKAAVDGMTRVLALEGAAKGIRVNNVNPGNIVTPMLEDNCDQATQRMFIAHTPLNRLGTADEVADVVVWLASDAARFVTGQTIVVDGGYSIPGPR